MVDLSQALPLKGSTNTMISSTLKPHTNAHTVCGRTMLVLHCKPRQPKQKKLKRRKRQNIIFTENREKIVVTQQ